MGAMATEDSPSHQKVTIWAPLGRHGDRKSPKESGGSPLMVAMATLMLQVATPSHFARPNSELGATSANQAVISTCPRVCIYRTSLHLQKDRKFERKRQKANLRSSSFIHGTPYLILHFSPWTHLIHPTLNIKPWLLHFIIPHPIISSPKSLVTFHQNTHIPRHIINLHSLHLGA